MKIVSWNVNGLRAIYKKGFVSWIDKNDPDIVCLQETKVKREQLSLDFFSTLKYNLYFNSADKKGYSGVCVYTKKKPSRIETKIGHKQFDQEGRFLLLDFEDILLVNLYLPHGGRNKEKLDYKMEVYSKLLALLRKNKERKTVLIGDFNIAHKDIDLARPRENQNNIMFTPEEREQINSIINVGFMDAFRFFHKEGGNYTWLSYRKSAREKGLGWRIDYAFVSEKLRNKLEDAFIFPETLSSDHCPIGVVIRL